MRKLIAIGSIMLLVLAVTFANAQVNVTFRANTSAVQGIVDSTGGVDIRGALQTPPWTPLANPMISDGGDYWSIVWTFDASQIGTTIEYKYGGTIKNPLTGIVTSYWENDLPGANYTGGNRTLVVPATDSVLAIDYVGTKTPPYVDDPDSIDVYFRVNMSTNTTFNPAVDTVCIAGNPIHIGWDPPHKKMTRELSTDYWHYHTIVSANNSPFNAEWKYTLGSWDGREESNNRSMTFNQDTTIQFVYYNDVVPVGAAGRDTLIATFRVDLTEALANDGLEPDDTVRVEWGWDGEATYGRDTLLYDPLSPGNFYQVQDTIFNVTFGEHLYYQYYITKYGNAIRENYYNFEYTGTNNTLAERRLIGLPQPTGSQYIEMVIRDTVEGSIVDPHRVPRFPDQTVLPKNVTVHWEVDLRPPYYQILLEGDTLEDIQAGVNVGPAQLDSLFNTWYVYLNGPATDGWTTWGSDLRNSPNKKMWDDGATNGDMTANDSIYTTTWFYSGPDSGDITGQVYKFGIHGGDNENGKGGFGNNHLWNIAIMNPGNPTPEEITWRTEFGSINPAFYWRWDFDLHVVGIDDQGPVTVVKTPRLDNNYPNPFNPVTTIRFVLPSAMDVKVEIYNSLGQRVTTLVDGKRHAGQHIINWSGIDSKGRPVSSGIYFLRLSTESYSKTLKMMLMK